MTGSVRLETPAEGGTNRADFFLTGAADKLIQAQPDRFELRAVYDFYRMTAKHQKTAIVFAKMEFVAEGLGIGRDRARRIRTRLVDLGLIKKVLRRNADGFIESTYWELTGLRYHQPPIRSTNSQSGGTSSAQLTGRPTETRCSSGFAAQMLKPQGKENALSPTDALTPLPVAASMETSSTDTGEAKGREDEEEAGMRRSAKVNGITVHYPTLPEAWQYALQVEISPELTTAWFREVSARSFHDGSGNDLRNWRGALLEYCQRRHRENGRGALEPQGWWEFIAQAAPEYARVPFRSARTFHERFAAWLAERERSAEVVVPFRPEIAKAG